MAHVNSENSGAIGVAAGADAETAAMPGSMHAPINSTGAADIATSDFDLSVAPLRPEPQRFRFEPGVESWSGQSAAAMATQFSESVTATVSAGSCDPVANVGGTDAGTLASADSLGELKPLGQVRSSFIVAVNGEGLWIIDQHVAHERVLFEQHLRARREGQLTGQRLLVPLVTELSPEQFVVFEHIIEELTANGFEVAEMGPRSVAIHATPAGIAGNLLMEILNGMEREHVAISMDSLQAKIAASTSCHAAIKVNMPLEQSKMEWLLAELSKTEAPMSCPHGRPIVLRYSVRDIERAFKRI
jgi:DNA mismatch repair protein MutL